MKMEKLQSEPNKSVECIGLTTLSRRFAQIPQNFILAEEISRKLTELCRDDITLFVLEFYVH